jgi:hypothetical protein
MNYKGEMMLFSFIAYYDFLQPETKVLEDNVSAMLETMKEHLKFSEVSWGPCGNKSKEILTDSLMFVVKNNNKHIDEYTLVIRGTNPLSIQSWLFQDLNVAGMVPWSRQSLHTKSTTAYISKATDTSLSIHKNLKSNNKTILDWTLSIIDVPNSKKIKLNITGHSLGGLMATTLGLWLTDELNGINKGDLVDLKIYAYAGPSAGNNEYRDYLDKTIGNNYSSINNYLDIVSHVWEENDVCKLPNIYGDLKMSDLENKVYEYIRDNIIGMNYSKLGNVIPVESKIINDFTQDYFIQAGVQHIIPYLEYALKRSPLISIEVFGTLLFDIIRDLISDFESIWGKFDMHNKFKEHLNSILNQK